MASPTPHIPSYFNPNIISRSEDETETKVATAHIQLGGSPQKSKSERAVVSTTRSQTQENKHDRSTLDLPIKSLDTTVSQQSNESFWPIEKSPKSSTPRQSLDPGADLPNYSMISVVAKNDNKEDEDKDETTVEDEKNTTVIERKSSSNISQTTSWYPKDWYYDLQVRLDSLIWKYQTLDQEYAFLQKIAGEQYEGVRKLAESAAKDNEEN